MRLPNEVGTDVAFLGLPRVGSLYLKASTGSDPCCADKSGNLKTV
jgi:hypothetical protein